MTVSTEDLAQLATALDDGRNAWIHGKPQWENRDSRIAQADDATIFGPFGGTAPPGQSRSFNPIVSVRSRRRSLAVQARPRSSAPSWRAISSSWSTWTAARSSSDPKTRTLDASGYRSVPQEQRPVHQASPPRRPARWFPRPRRYSSPHGLNEPATPARQFGALRSSGRRLKFDVYVRAVEDTHMP